MLSLLLTWGCKVSGISYRGRAKPSLAETAIYQDVAALRFWRPGI